MIRAIKLARSSLLSRFSPAWSRDSLQPYSQVAEKESLAARLFVVQPRLRPESALQSKLAEAVSLANSLEDQRDGVFDSDVSLKETPEHVIVQNPSARGHKAHADTYFGSGTVETVKIHLNNVESKGDIDAVFVNTMLTGIQQRNLEIAWAKPVLDRVGLIIEIFHAHANTREGKLQAELAALTYKKTRLVRVRRKDGRSTFGVDGEAEVVSARGRGSGGRGFIGGAGETEIDLQRQRIKERRKILLASIEEVRRTRALQRASRKRHGGTHGLGLATVAIVGYTNAGKSTLVSALSDSPLFSDARLFATVDPRLRNAVLPSGRKVLVSDTVGFISDLPVQLVKAFHATLEEVVEADLLVHVLDSTAPNLDEHRTTVLGVLEQIGVSKEKLENMIEVWNKIDCQARHGDGNEHVDDNEAGNTSIENENDMESACTVEEPVDDDGALESIDEDDREVDQFDELSESEDDQSPQNAEVDSCSIPMEIIVNAQQRERSHDNLPSYGDRSSPDVKTSALKRIGLQELLELVDERLSDQDEKSRPKMDLFDRKWRPSCEEDSQVAT